MKNKFNLFGILFMSILVLVLSYNSFAQDGSLDLSFGNGGKVITPIGLGQDIGYSVAIQADGKIVMAGSSYIVNDDFALSRYNSNGSLDLSFGTSGIVTTSIGSAGDVAHSVAIQTDGKIVVAGYSYINNHRDFALTRYNTNGSLDTSFDTDGKVTTPIGSSTDEGYAVAIQADGKIVVAGTTFNGSIFDFALIRYNSNGSLDLSFDIDGIVTTHIGSGTSFGYAVAMQADGKIVVAGFSDNGSDYDFALTRYNSNGSLDLGFDIDGIVTTPIGLGSSFGYAVAIQTDGKIVVAGTSYNGNDHDFAVTRYNSNGSLDLSFDTDGKANPLIGFGTEWKMTVAIQADGKIVAAGPINNGMNYDFGLARFNSDGSLDLSFDADGIVTTPIGITNDSGYSVAIQADGKIVVAGCLNNNGNTFDFALVRYNNTPTMVSTDLSGNCGQISIHPNPFSSTTIIKTDQLLKNATITIYNLFGEQIKQIENINVQSITLSRNNLPNGFYFIHLTQDNKVLSRKECLVVD